MVGIVYYPSTISLVEEVKKKKFSLATVLIVATSFFLL